MTATKCVSVDEDLSKLARENDLSWSKAATIGMGVMLGDLLICEYPKDNRLVRKMLNYKFELMKVLNAE